MNNEYAVDLLKLCYKLLNTQYKSNYVIDLMDESVVSDDGEEFRGTDIVRELAFFFNCEDDL